MSIKRMLSMICLVSATVVFGQTARFPFPMDVEYPHGHRHSAVTAQKAQTWYNSWKTEFIRECPTRGLMPTADHSNQVKVEGVGWALIAAAYMGDKETFDGVYRFYNSKTTSRAGGMMGWDVTCESIVDEGSATDGDIDVAFGLIVASWQWGGNYLDSARRVITRLRPLIIPCNGVFALAGGFAGGPWGGTCDDVTDLSYFTPAFFRVFAEVSGDNIWYQLAEDTYIHLERNTHPATGLISDWQRVRDGVPTVGPSGQATDTTYRYDACRVPWRLALDYLWNGDERAKVWNTNITNWAHGVGVNNLRAGYTRAGVPIADYSAGFSFIGAWAVGAMANDNEAVRSAFANSVMTNNDNYWYHRHTGNMYLLAMTGNMWREDMVAGEGHRLIVSINGGGTVGRQPNKTRYEPGETVTLTAVPNTGWAFVRWEGGATGTDVTTTVTMSANVNVTAIFEMAVDGSNLIKNGDFAAGMEDWTLNTWGNSQATASTASGAFVVNIQTLPTTGAIWDLQLVQGGIPLLEGNRYAISFQASAVQARTIGVILQIPDDPWTTYFSEDVALTNTMQTFNYEFEMEDDDITNGRLAFNFGNHTANVTIDNVSIVLVGTTSIQSRGTTPKSGAAAPLITVKGRTLNITAAAGSNARIRVVNLSGRTVANFRSKGSASFSLRKIPAGKYVVEVTRDGVRTTSQIVLK